MYVRGLLSIICGFYHTVPSQTIFSGAIKYIIKKGALWFCTCSNLRILRFNNPEYRPLQAWSSIIVNYSTICTRAFGLDQTLNGQYFTYIYVVPTNSRTNHVFAQSFSPGIYIRIKLFPVPHEFGILLGSPWINCVVPDRPTLNI